MPESRGAGENPFWDFSLALYGTEGASRACIDLQDRLGADVNLLLFCCWAGRQGRRLAGGELDRLEAASADWRARVIGPLRAVRRALRQADDAGARALYDNVKAQELAAERIAQDRLHAALPLGGAGSGGCGSATEANLALYLGRLDLAVPEADPSVRALLAVAAKSGRS